MSLVADDLIRFSSVLKITYNLLKGRDYLKRKKFREKKKLIAVGLPFSDLVYGFPELVPILPIRMQEFKIHKYFTYLGSASAVFGWKNISTFLGYVKKMGIGETSHLLDDIIDDVIDTISQKYNEMYDIGIESGIPNDFCFGLKTLYGMNTSKLKNCDGSLNFTIRCSAWNKYLESLKTINNHTKQIWVDIPPRNIGNSSELLVDNLYDAIRDLEKISGNSYDEKLMTNHFRVANQIKSYYKTIVNEIGGSDFYPCNPATYSEILALLNITFQDYNSNAIRYRDNIGTLLSEMRERIKKKIGMDVSDRPRIVVTPMFGGWEPTMHNFIFDFGGRVLYNDWEMLRFLDEIPLSKKSDPIEAYADFLVNITNVGIGCDNETLTDSYVEMAKQLKADGLVFVQVFGCHSISNCFTMLKEKLRQELEIPSIAVNFNKIGENVEQLRTRLGAFMEMFR